MKKTIEINPKQLVIDWVSATAFTPVNKVAMRKLGHRAAILISETINQYKRWSAEGKLQNDMFYWTEESCEIETALNKSAQNREFKKLEELSLLKRVTKKIHGTKTFRFIKLNFDNIVSILFEDVDKTKDDIKKKHEQTRERNKVYKERFALKRKLQNESSGKLQNESSGKLQNGTQVINKDLNKNSDLNKNDLKNLSIYEKINNLNMPSAINKVLQNRIDRLNSEYLSSIELKFNAYRDVVNVDKFADILNTVLEQKIHKESAFPNYLDRSINQYIDNRAKTMESINKKPLRKEHEPDWLDEKTPAAQVDHGHNEDFLTQKAELEKKLQKYKK
jgi:hypothetical protein